MSNTHHTDSHTETKPLESTVAPLAVSTQLDLPEFAPSLPTLAMHREAKGFSVEHVAGSLRLRNSQIIALEQLCWEDLPGPAYIKGFLRSYCKFLNVPAEPYIEHYAKQVGIYVPPVAIEVPKIGVSAKADLSAPQALASFDNVDEVKAQKQLMLLIALALVGFTVVFLLYWERAMWWNSLKESVSVLYIDKKQDNAASFQAEKVVLELSAGSKNTALQDNNVDATVTKGSQHITPITSSQAVVLVDQKASSTSTSPQYSLPSQPPVIVTAKTALPVVANTGLKALDKPALATSVVAPTPPLSANARSIDLRFTQPVWAEVRDKTGAVIATGMQAGNSSTSVKGNPPLLVIIGAAHAAKLSVDGRPVDLAPHTVANVAKVKVE